MITALYNRLLDVDFDSDCEDVSDLIEVIRTHGVIGGRSTIAASGADEVEFWSVKKINAHAERERHTLGDRANEQNR